MITAKDDLGMGCGIEHGSSIESHDHWCCQKNIDEITSSLLAEPQGHDEDNIDLQGCRRLGFYCSDISIIFKGEPEDRKTAIPEKPQSLLDDNLRIGAKHRIRVKSDESR